MREIQIWSNSQEDEFAVRTDNDFLTFGLLPRRTRMSKGC